MEQEEREVIQKMASDWVVKEYPMKDENAYESDYDYRRAIKDRRFYKSLFIAGATAYATRTAQQDKQLEKENEELETALVSYNDRLNRQVDDNALLRVALRKIEQMSDPGDYWKAICDMKSIATDALNISVLKKGKLEPVDQDELWGKALMIYYEASGQSKAIELLKQNYLIIKRQK